MIVCTKKDKLKQLSRIYDKLYDRMNKLLKQYNPCNISKKRGIVKCIRGKPCCVGCRHLSRNGCKVKALYCKLWLCPYLHENYDIIKLVEKRKILYKRAERLNLVYCRESKKEILEHLRHKYD